ncbi:MAG: N-6 DNA methylase [Pirellulaceae bacterium]|nr:N-6 DNA methylase [Pirellulaceae bacterium]
MRLDQAREWLGWPESQQITNPSGAGAKIYADFAKRKIGESLTRSFPNVTVEKICVLAANPNSADTVAPLAVICEFSSDVSPEVLDEAHRLAWSFSRTALLVTLEPHRLIAWSCCCDPSQSRNERQLCELATPDGFKPTGSAQQRSVRDLLHWVSLLTGHFQRKQPKKFRTEGRADELLLKNLRHVRSELLGMDLSQDYCHDLLARIIFSQFLFHRRDRGGDPFFSDSLLNRLHGTVLRDKHTDLSSILKSKEDTYSLFRWLDDRFNGDLFPGKEDSSADERDNAWQAEKDAVGPEHLGLLADLVSGTINTKDQQLQLWPRYSFDVIPLEFISSVYEEFLDKHQEKNKAYYTPPHLVDYVLDAVLPWGGKEWNLKVLDPSCGSGIFLVKAFQRLIHRWRNANGREPLVSDLKPILADNLIGVDINSDAVRVASFSLYLAMADAIEPKHYVTREKVFPRLRGKRLVVGDFFDESTRGFRTTEDAATFDIVVGNAPWGDKSIKETSQLVSPSSLSQARVTPKVTQAQLWAKLHEWPVANNDIGPLFLAKALALIRKGGHVAMLQPASTWLYQRAGEARRLRKRLFESYTVEEVTNLTPIRRELFSRVIGPACVIVVTNGAVSPDTGGV